MKDILLIFFATVSILLLGIYFGNSQIEKSYEISDSTRNLSEPFRGRIDESFLKNVDPAL